MESDKMKGETGKREKKEKRGRGKSGGNQGKKRR